jgi:pimeloyl-ACP methyl ester carboxylesterase
VADLLWRLHVPAATVVGHSWSGGVAIALAEDHPELVSGLVLVASVGPAERPSRLDRALALPVVGPMAAAVALRVAARGLSLPPVRRFLDRRLRGTDEESLIALANTWRMGDAWRSYVIEQRALVDELPALAPGLGRIRASTVVLVGDSDRIVRPATGERLAAAIPGARLLRVPGAGHLLPQQRPDAVAAAVADVADVLDVADVPDVQDARDGEDFQRLRPTGTPTRQTPRRWRRRRHPRAG